MKYRLFLFLMIFVSFFPVGAQDANPIAKLEAITPENAAQVRAIRRIGYGVIQSIAWSPDGNTLGVGTSVGLLLYDATDWSEENGTDTSAIPLILDGQPGVYSVAFSPDSKIVASGGADGSIFLRDVASGQVRVKLQLELAQIDALRFSRSRNLLAATDMAGNLRVLDLRTGGELLRFDGGISVGVRTPILPPSLSFSRGENLLGVGWNGVARVFDLASGLESLSDFIFCDEFYQFTPEISVAFTPDSDHLLYVSYCPYPLQGILGSWKPGDELPFKESVPKHPYDATPLRLDSLPNGDVLQYTFDTHGGNYGDFLIVNDLTQNSDILGDSEQVDLFAPFAWNDQKTLFAGVGVSSQKTEIYVGNSGADLEVNVALLDGFSAPAPGFAFGADQTLLFRRNYDRYLVIDAITGLQLAAVEGSLSFPASSPISPDGKLLAVVGPIEVPDGYFTDYKWVIHILDSKTGEEQIVLEDNGYSIAVAWSPDGHLLVSGNRDGTVSLWDVSTGQSIAVLPGHTLPVRGIAFNADGSLIASTSDDGTIRMWGIPKWA